MTHIHTIGRPLCERELPIGAVGETTKLIYHEVTCPRCMRRAITEAEERVLAMRQLLAEAERAQLAETGHGP